MTRILQIMIVVNPPAFYVNCDPQKINQVIFNLLDNAMKFSTKGKIFISTTFLINGKEQHHFKYHKNTKDTNNKISNNTNDNIITCLDGDKNNMIITVKDMAQELTTILKTSYLKNLLPGQQTAQD